VSEPLTPAAARFIAGHVGSVGTLDLILLLHGARDRVWTRADLCRTLRCPDPWIEGQLAGLVELELLTPVGEDRYCYRRGPRYGGAVDDIARACRHDRGAVTRRIFARSPVER
jgi:hypothetical protein